MKLKIEIGECGVIPWGYGVAWRRWDTLTAVLLPLPFNLVVRACRDLYFSMVHGWSPRKYEHAIWEAWSSGYAMQRFKQDDLVTRPFEELVTAVRGRRGGL